MFLITKNTKKHEGHKGFIVGGCEYQAKRDRGETMEAPGVVFAGGCGAGVALAPADFCLCSY